MMMTKKKKLSSLGRYMLHYTSTAATLYDFWKKKQPQSVVCISIYFSVKYFCFYKSPPQSQLNSINIHLMSR